MSSDFASTWPCLLHIFESCLTKLARSLRWRELGGSLQCINLGENEAEADSSPTASINRERPFGDIGRVQRSIVECELLIGTRSAEGIMASGLVCRTNRPSIWLHLHHQRCKREKSPCQHGAIHT